MADSRIILGIDPGTVVMGFGLISVDGKVCSMLNMGVLKLDKYSDPLVRLARIYDRISAIITEYHPAEVALEAPFFGKNVQSMLKLGRAQGVAMAPALQAGIPVFEYSPRSVKQSITGNGNASKEQVATLVQTILKIKETSKYLDATDGLAVALCHFYQDARPASGGGPSSWQEFLRKNPGRVH